MSLIRPKKSLSQNYLTDENISRDIVSEFKINKSDNVVEIGGGKGALTKYLYPQTDNLTIVELDKNNYLYLRENFPKAKVINDDILKINFDDIFNGISPVGRVIGNIPYNITSPILFKLADNRHLLVDTQLMIQEEVAQRLNAKPGTKAYGILSVFMQVYFNIELKFKVSRNLFYPKPDVDSRIVYVKPDKKYESKIKDLEFFKSFVRASFSKRRKTLKNALKESKINIENIHFDFNRRAETLSIEEFIALSNQLFVIQ